MIDYCPRKIVGLPVLAELGHGVFILVFGNSLCGGDSDGDFDGDDEEPDKDDYQLYVFLFL